MIAAKKKQHKFIRLSKVRAYLLLKNIKKQLKEQERKAHIRP